MSAHSPELSPSATMAEESAVAVEKAPERRHSVEAAGRLVAEANSRSSRGEVADKVDAEQMEGSPENDNHNDNSPQKRLHEHDHHHHRHGHHYHHHDPVIHDHDVFPHHNAMHEAIPAIANEVDPMVHTDLVHEHGHHDTFHQEDFHHDRFHDVPHRYREEQFATTGTAKRQLVLGGDDERSAKTVNFSWVTNRGAIRGVA